MPPVFWKKYITDPAGVANGIARRAGVVYSTSARSAMVEARTVPGALIGVAVVAAALAAEEPAVRWFGSSESDFARAATYAGKPLRVKARFVKCLAPAKGSSGAKRLRFLVATEGGDLRCEMGGSAEEAELVRGMKRCTPLVIDGTMNRRGTMFRVTGITQGWGKSRLEGVKE